MAKTNNHTRNPRKPTKSQSQNKLSDFMFVNSWQKKKATRGFIERLAGRLLEYFSDKNKIVLEEFFDDEDIAEQSYYGWLKEWDLLRQVHEQIMTRLAARREKGMLLGGVKERSGMHVQHQFSKRWRDADLYWSELKEREHRAVNTEAIAYIEALQDTDGNVVVRRCVKGKPVEEEK